VGQQCVECVRNANRGTRQATAPFGGKVATGRPLVTWTLVALNVLVYLVEIAKPDLIITKGALVGRLGPTIGVAHGQWYRLITSAFIHEPLTTGIGFTHILFNMWALIIVGPALEQVFGRLRFLAIYVVSALGGAVLFILIAKPEAAAFGASGAVFGLFGAWFVVAKRLRLDSRQVVILIVLNLAITFVFRSSIAWQDHLGGLAAGAALAAAYAYAPRANRTLIQVAATAALVALLVVGVLVRDHQLTTAALAGFR
jgi:membrane associated rhomboid family serine protease